MGKKKRARPDGGEATDENLVEDEPMEGIDTSGDESSDDEDAEGDETKGESEEELMQDDVGDAETINFDFEAFPLEDADKEGVMNMLTQIFLRADVDVSEMAASLIQQSPIGCVFRPAEEFADEDSENVVYGLVSMIELGIKKKYECDIWSLLRSRAKKFAVEKRIVERLDSLATREERGVCLLVNERMLHFPTDIAAPAFTSLRDDLAKAKTICRFDTVIAIVKIRIADGQSSGDSGQTASNATKKGKKLGKAAKKRAAAAALADADVIFDNPEEALLFSLPDSLKVEFFQYSVQSEVEKESKFNVILKDGITYRPYRRVCILSRETFERYMEAVSSARGL